ncbi:MAG: hypothetical protein ACR2L2_10080 [Acidobacteriota bacterium]
MRKLLLGLTIVAWLWTGTPVAAGDSSDVRAAVEESIALLQRSGPTFVKSGACTSCHHQSIPAMTVSIARQRGLRVDETIAREQLAATARFAASIRERSLQGVAVGGAADTVAYTLLGMAAEKYPPDAVTDALIQYIKRLQARDGRWRAVAHRPPTEYSDITATALGLRALQLYGHEGQRAASSERVKQAAAWLLRETPAATEERAFQLLGLAWAKQGGTVIETGARALLAEQRADGGWAQTSKMESDAYATGLALVALHQAGELEVNDPAYRRGVGYLLKTQFPDGSWHVKTRSIPIMPFFGSGFPHGHDQWISAFATGWAAMALSYTVEP